MSNEPKVNPEDFSEAEHAAVEAIAAPIIKERAQLIKNEKKFLSQNRDTHKRMNNPEKAAKMEIGADMHLRLIDKALALTPIRPNGFAGIAGV